MKLFSNKEIDSNYIKKFVIFLAVMCIFTLLVFPLATPIFIIGLIIWIYRYKQYTAMGK